MKVSPFFSGIPTEPDVQKLVAHFGVPVVGRMLPYSEIAAVLGVDVHDSRFRSVVSAWRRQMDDKNNLLLKAVPNVGYQVLNNKERITFASSTFRNKIRGIRRVGTLAARTDDDGLDSSEKRTRDHIVATSAVIQTAVQRAARELKPTQPAETKRALSQ